VIEGPDVAILREKCIDIIKEFKQRLMKMNVLTSTVDSAVYGICAMVDETVLSTTWGSDSLWTQGSLLSLFYKETWGGERFYDLLAKKMKAPQQHIDEIELFYFLMNLGFEGKFYGEHYHGLRKKARSQIFDIIKVHRSKSQSMLASCAYDASFSTYQDSNRFSFKWPMCFMVLSFVLVWAVFNVKVYHSAKPLLDRILTQHQDSPARIFLQEQKRDYRR
jgi:type VI secretion system protein ImpK